MAVFVRRLIAGCVLLALFVAPAGAQSFVVESTSPAQGATGVSEETQVRFEFSQELCGYDSRQCWQTFFALPSGDVPITNPALLLGDKGRPSVVRWDASHKWHRDDYFWLVYTVRNVSGKLLDEPYVLHYTTADDIGQRSVSGTVAGAPTVAATPPALRASLQEIAQRLERSGMGTPVYQARDRDVREPDMLAKGAPSGAVPITARAGLDQEYTRIYLLDSFSGDPGRWTLRGADVIKGTAGSFSADYVREGTYWPVAIRYTDDYELFDRVAPPSIEAIGFYDADGDGAPDPVTVDASDVTDVTLQMYDFTLESAATNYERARRRAETVADDQELFALRAGYGARPAGKAYVWTYEFYAPSQDLRTVVNVDPLTESVVTLAAPSDWSSRLALVDSFLDSDAAAQEALQAGGQSVLDEHDDVPLAVTMRGGALDEDGAPQAMDAYWYVRFDAYTAGETFTHFVELEAKTVDAEAPISTSAFRLAPAYPNPFRAETRLAFTLPQPEPVTLSVYDALGRQVATLLDGGVLPGGAHAATWRPAGVAPGVYLVRLQAGGQVQTQRVVVH